MSVEEELGCGGFGGDGVVYVGEVSCSLGDGIEVACAAAGEEVEGVEAFGRLLRMVGGWNLL
jgi:hypothetical protein